MCTFKRILITNRHICGVPLLKQLEKVLPEVRMVILREKDMEEEGYEALAGEVMSLCAAHKKTCVLHSFPDAARRLGCPNIHMPFARLRECLGGFGMVGTSVHSVREAKEAEELNASYLVAGHIFETDCKKGISPRGTGFLKEICDAVTIPVYAVGGINDENEGLIKACGAAGACRMSYYMKKKK